MARAKRTDRAEARRRYRAYLAETGQLGVEDGEAGETSVQPAARVDAERPSGPQPPQRMGFFAAMKAAMRPVHYVDDLRYMPRLITGSPAVWLPSIIAIASAIVAISSLRGATLESAENDIAVQVTAGFVLNPYMPMLPALIAGFFAPRASWLAGVLVCFVTTIAFVVVITYRPELFPLLFEPGTVVTVDRAVATALSFMTLSLPLGALLAAFSAWYKRFLELTGPASARAQQRTAARKKAAARRPSSRR